MPRAAWRNEPDGHDNLIINPLDEPVARENLIPSPLDGA
jgi:hypothetical protein